MSLNIAKDGRKRIVIVGGGFGGLQVANKLKGTDYQVILIDKNNYHQFPPLFFRVMLFGLVKVRSFLDELYRSLILQYGFLALPNLSKLLLQ